MASWSDEHKLKYISIHLQDDAHQWWIQASKRIPTWSKFVKEIKQAFEQLRWYKQSINQTITQYYDKIIELCTRIDPDVPDLLKLQYLIAGRNVHFLHIKRNDAELIVGVKNALLGDEYQHRLPLDMFNRHQFMCYCNKRVCR
ncbi:unnamed protein product [Rotaria socialis]